MTPVLAIVDVKQSTVELCDIETAEVSYLTADLDHDVMGNLWVEVTTQDRSDARMWITDYTPWYSCHEDVRRHEVEQRVKEWAKEKGYTVTEIDYFA